MEPADIPEPARRQSVLIVDDEPGNIQIVAEVLRDECDLFFATSGAEALRVAQLVRPDLILLDLLMPEMDGFETCRRLKVDPAVQDIPVVFVTARDDVDGETRGLEVGGIDYVTKPISLPVLRARVRVHLRLKRREDELRARALVDGLTGIANRRRLDEVLEQEWRRARRAQEPLSVAFLDVDHFKRYNDRYGHLEGDACLRRIAAVLRSLARRPGDFAARFGGEEFLCLLPRTDLDGVAALAERIRAGVLNERIPHADSGAGPWVSVSVGAACVVPGARHGPPALLGLADRMLYRAKQAGRNRVEAARLEPEDPA